MKTSTRSVPDLGGACADLHKHALKLLPLCCVAGTLLIGCGGGGGGGANADDTNSGNTATGAFQLDLDFDIKQLKFSWAPVAGATYYRLYENRDGASGFTQVGGDLATTEATLEIATHRHDWDDARYLVEACSDQGCVSSNEAGTLNAMLQAIGYFKSSNTDSKDGFGYSVSLSADGRTVAVGAYGEDSAATSVDGDQSDNSAAFAGAVYVFVNDGGAWAQQAYLKASNATDHDSFGYSLSLSLDGDTLAVAAPDEDSIAEDSGAVYVFTRGNSTWSEQAFLKASNPGTGDGFGWHVSLSGDGQYLAVGAKLEDSAATGVNGDSANNGAQDSGAAYVFARAGDSWSEQAYVKASNTNAGDFFGKSVALDLDGDVLAVGACCEAGGGTGVNNTNPGPGDNSTGSAGAAYVFTRSGSSWTQEAYVKASNTGSGDSFGFSIDLDDAGTTLAVGAPGENSAATGINGNGANNSALDAGAAYVFVRTGGGWTQQAYVKASNTGGGDQFGYALALSGDGTTLAVGAQNEDGSGNGVNPAANDSNADAGAVYVFKRSGTTWSQEAYVKATNSETNDKFGSAVALSDDGTTLAVGAYRESSNATGIGGNQGDNSSSQAGAVYLF